jgi:hypothetical protein
LPVGTHRILVGDILSLKDSVSLLFNHNDSAITTARDHADIHVFKDSNPRVAHKIVVIEDFGSEVETVVDADLPVLSSGAHGDIEGFLVVIVELGPASSFFVFRSDSFSPEELVLSVHSHDMTITSDVELNPDTGVIHEDPVISWVFNLDSAKLLEPNIMAHVNSPKDWTVANRDVHILTGKLFPALSGLVSRSHTTSVVHFVSKITKEDLAVTDGDHSS